MSDQGSQAQSKPRTPLLRGGVRRCDYGFVRSGPSQADRELIRSVREEYGGIEVSPTQLERWRGHGLLPRVDVVREGFGGTSIATHPPEVVAAAAQLGCVSRRGRPWQLDAEHLFNEGHKLTQDALREAATHIVKAENAHMRAAWEEGRRQAARFYDLGHDTANIGDIGQFAVQALPKYARDAVRNEITKAHSGRGVSGAELQELVGHALTWRMVDLVEPEALEDEHKNLARHGVETCMKPEGDGAYPLPSERELVAQTLTWDEAACYRPFAEARVRENRALTQKSGKTGPRFGLLYVTTWIVAYERLKVSPSRMKAPLPPSKLDEAADFLAGVDHVG